MSGAIKRSIKIVQAFFNFFFSHFLHIFNFIPKIPTMSIHCGNFWNKKKFDFIIKSTKRFFKIIAMKKTSRKRNKEK